MENLSKAKIGKLYLITTISNSASIKIKRRLLELGFTKGQFVKLVRKSFLAKTFLIELRGFTLTIRKDVASLIEIKEG